MTKGRPRGTSDLGRPTLQIPPRSNGYAFPSLPPTDENASGSSEYALLPSFFHSHSSPKLTPASSSSSFDSLEILSALLLPLPFLLATLNNPRARARRHVHHSSLEIAEEALEEVALSAVPVPDSLLNLIETCLLTAGTLLLVGLWGRMRQKSPSSRKRKVTLTSATQPNVSAKKASGTSYLKSLLKRIACVALPYLATVEIGGVRTSVILLTAAATGLLGSDSTGTEEGVVKRAKHVLKHHSWFCVLFAMCMARDLYWHVPGTEYSATIRGYVALTKSLLLLQPPFAAAMQTASAYNGSRDPSPVPSSPRSPGTRFGRRPAISSLIASRDDINLTLVAGASIAALAALLSMLGSPLHVLNFTNITLFLASIGAAAAMYILGKPGALRTPRKLGLAVGLIFGTLFSFYFQTASIPAALAVILLSGLAYTSALFDDKATGIHSHPKKDHHHDHGHTHRPAPQDCSRFTKLLLARTGDSPILHDILSDKESRRIVYFMTINLGFMFVQTFYSVVSGSLGLLSDSIHMFFDCMGLLAGLIASIMSRWPPNEKFPYGYGKVETLSGLGNGIFLMIISVEIIWESIERFMEGAQLKRLTELMLISVGGLAVNLIGLLFIGHAHHHGHDHGHDHGHGHSHDHANENMMGIYLHILADTMGSVAVIASTALTAYTGWSGWDPIASAVIAILIIAASLPLVVGSARRLLLTLPSEVEYHLRSSLQELSNLRGVAGYSVPRFWMEDGEHRHAHEHDHSHDHDHEHHHSHDHEHSHAGHNHGHSHEHTHEHKHGDENKHGHDHHHDYDHDHDNDHEHDHDHKHSHANGHSHKHDHSHSHTHAHSHEHDHGHSHEHHEHGQKILGVIHLIASRGADTEDVRSRAAAFFEERNMQIVIQVDREGAGRCWCGGDKSWSAHNRVSSIVPGLG